MCRNKQVAIPSARPRAALQAAKHQANWGNWTVAEWHEQREWGRAQWREIERANAQATKDKKEEDPNKPGAAPATNGINPGLAPIAGTGNNYKEQHFIRHCPYLTENERAEHEPIFKESRGKNSGKGGNGKNKNGGKGGGGKGGKKGPWRRSKGGKSFDGIGHEGRIGHEGSSNRS